MEKAFWDETKSFLQSKVVSVALMRGKTTCELDFSISNKTEPPSPNYVPRGKTVTAAYLHKALATIYSGFWAKKTKHVCTELVFGQASAPKANAASFFNNWLWKKA